MHAMHADKVPCAAAMAMAVLACLTSTYAFHVSGLFVSCRPLFGMRLERLVRTFHPFSSCGPQP
jgi:hypothetical protein